MSATDDIRRLIGSRVLENEPMSAHTTLGVGGPADVFVEVGTEDELAALMRYLSREALPWMILGDGSNLLISDKGIRGVVISPVGDFKRIEVRAPVIEAGAAARISAVADVAAERDLAGIEGVGTVPGTVGGAIVMNAGTHRGCIDKVVESVSVVTHAGDKRLLSREECGFTYRGSRFQTDRSMIITGVTLRLRPGDGQAIRDHLDQVRRHRAETQPQGKSAGCFFKNVRLPLPSGAVGAKDSEHGIVRCEHGSSSESFAPTDLTAKTMSAGKLIESAGGKGLREGGAIVSDIHANFILNGGGATAADLRNLAERVRGLVREKHGIELEYEVRIIGEW